MVQSPPGDLLMGARAIADYLGITPRQLYHLVETKRLPHFYEGRTVCARKTTLSAWLANRESRVEPEPRAAAK